MPEPVYIPAYIRVKLGSPDSDSQTVTVPFLLYVKNVASSEIYPTWPESAIRANMYAQISFALNRIYTEHYRSRGFDFDITSLPAYDQAYVHERGIFGPMEKIGNELFNDYIVRGNNVEPLLAVYCDGRSTTCAGLSQWGTLDLANQGLIPLDILKRYYGNDIQIVRNAPILNVTQSYPGYPLRRGDRGANVATIQNELNRVSQSYPSIPKIDPVDGIFGEETENAVKAFQSAFQLTSDGIVGKDTWYKLLYIYTAVKNLESLHSEGEKLRGVPQEFQRTLRLGDRGKDVNLLQFYLNTIASSNPAVPSVAVTSNYNPETVAAVKAFQSYAGLPATGVTDRATYDRIYNDYQGVVLAHEAIFRQGTPKKYPGAPLRPGSTGSDVTTLQLYLLAISKAVPEIPEVVAIGYFGDMTEKAVRAFQQKYGINPDGIVGPETWDKIISVYTQIAPSVVRTFEQYPGYKLV
jgi:peptidoglycan hydrolase-like protein with peptidoglycan-binding domain